MANGFNAGEQGKIERAVKSGDPSGLEKYPRLLAEYTHRRNGASEAPEGDPKPSGGGDSVSAKVKPAQRRTTARKAPSQRERAATASRETRQRQAVLKDLPPDVYGVADARLIASEPLDEIIPGELWTAGEKIVIAGPPKQLKTWFAIHMCRCVALGEPLLGDPLWTPEPQPILFVQEEGARQRWARRVAKSFPETEDNALFYYSHRKRFQLEDAESVKWLIDSAGTLSARGIIIDPWQRVTAGMNENDTGQTGPAWDAVHEIASETKAGVCLLHHTRKDAGLSIDAIRGSSRMAGEADLLIVMRKTADGKLEINLDGREHYRPDFESGNLIVTYGDPPATTMRHEGFTKPKVTTKAMVVGILLAAGSNWLETGDVRNRVIAAGHEVTVKTVRTVLNKLYDDRDVQRGDSKRHSQAHIWRAKSA